MKLVFKMQIVGALRQVIISVLIIFPSIILQRKKFKAFTVKSIFFLFLLSPFIYTGSERSAEFSTRAGLSRDWNLTNKHEPRPGRVGIHVHESVKKFAFMVTLRLKLRFIYSIMCQD